MRESRVKTRIYKTRRGCAAWVILPVLLSALLLCGAYLAHEGYFSRERFTPLQPAPTFSPVQAVRESREITLPSAVWYALSMADCASQSAARQSAAAFQARGAAGYVIQRERFLVLGAAYETRSDAQQVLSQLRSLHGVESSVIEILRPEITLRLTGQKAQLDALQDAYAFIDQAAAQCAALSQGLDRHTVRQEHARLALLSQQDTLDALCARLDQAFGPDAPGQVAGVGAVLRDLKADTAAAANQSGAALGAQVKACQLLCICRMADYAASLSQR